MGKIGILGGTFDPIHIGHLMLAEWAIAEGLDEVWFIPSGQSYMKTDRDVLPGTERLRMTELAVMDNLSFRCLDIEVKRAGFTYSYETLEQLKETYPEDEFFFIVGADCLGAIENWKNPERLFACCTLFVAVRSDVPMELMEAQKLELEKKFHARIRWLPFLRMSISSTEVRRRLGQGQSVRYMVPDKVLEYILEKGYYHGQQ